MLEQDIPKCVWLWISPRQSRSICDCGYVHTTAGISLKGLWPKHKSALEKVLLEACVAMDKSTTQRVHP